MCVVGNMSFFDFFSHVCRREHVVLLSQKKCADLYMVDLQHGEKLVEASTQHRN